jgi:hypothetical protein
VWHTTCGSGLLENLYLKFLVGALGPDGGEVELIDRWLRVLAPRARRPHRVARDKAGDHDQRTGRCGHCKHGWLRRTGRLCARLRVLLGISPPPQAGRLARHAICVQRWRAHRDARTECWDLARARDE